MDVLAIVSKGLEEEGVKEVERILKRPAEVKHGAVQFSVEHHEQIAAFIYQSQLAQRVLLLIDSYPYEDSGSLIATATQSFPEKIKPYRALIEGNQTYRVKCKSENLSVITPELEAEFGGVIHDAFPILKVDLRYPEVVFYLYIADKAYLGIDYSDDISKREYRVFNSALSLKGTTAFGVLALAGYTEKPEKKIVFDPLCNSGTIVIEAALFGNKVPHRIFEKKFPFMRFSGLKETAWDAFFAKIDAKQSERKLPITGSDPLLRNVTAAKKNAKVGSIESAIEFRRIDIDWLDTKFDEASVDLIVTFIPGSSKHQPNIAKLYKEFFYQTEYIIRKTGQIVVLCLAKDLLIAQSEEYVTLEKTHEIYSGEQLMHVLFFKKKAEALSVKKPHKKIQKEEFRPETTGSDETDHKHDV